MGVMHAIGDVLAGLAAIGFVLLVALMLGQLHLIRLHLRLRQAGLAAEAARLANGLTDASALPRVVIQIPTFNEGAIVSRAVMAACNLDWPASRLTIQVLDDSTDDASLAAAIAACDTAMARGMDAAVRHRTDRHGFKAGALEAGVAASDAAYFAVLDVDYIPPADFLRRCMAVMLADPALAFVQARFDYLNPDDNRTTQAQAILLDAHLGVEQATRSWAGHMLPFNGTCGIWRRAAIEAAGGWRGDTLAEDLDLSYRAWQAGWRGVFLTSVAVPGELPADLGAWMKQQHRWTKGFGQVARRLLPLVLRPGGVPAGRRTSTLIHLGAWWGAPVSAATIGFAVAAIVLHPALFWWIFIPSQVLSIAGQTVMFSFMRVGNRFLRGDQLSLRRFAWRYLWISLLSLANLFANLRAYVDAALDRSSAFQRTPKRGNPAV